MGLILKLFFAFVIFILPRNTTAQMIGMSFAKGTITDSVFCIANSSESYSLFLPDNYEDSKEWPVLLIFDPGARGRTAIEKFVRAGKKYGYILACSNTVKNGNFSIMLDKMEIMYRDVIKRFKVDARRVFTSGFSGGSRIALAFSINNKRIAGVIGCGAGMPDIKYYRPALMSHLIYFGIVGNKDMNYLEMNDLSLLLTNSGILSYFMVFDGGHEWPSANNLEFALGWIELHMMRKGVIEKRDNFLNDFILKMKAIAKESENKSDFVASKRYYSCVFRDFPESPLIADLIVNQEKFEKTDTYKQGLIKWNRNHDEELLKREKYLKAFSDIALNNELTDSIVNWWKSEINSLNSNTRRNRSSDSLMDYRILNMLTIASVEYGNKYVTTGNYQVAALFFKIWTICDPGKYNSWYNLARAYAFNRQKDEAISALEKSIRNGLNNKEIIIKDKAFINILNDKRFIRLISKMN
jgi:tetratricopeptide (TPR) repeat protein